MDKKLLIVVSFIIVAVLSLLLVSTRPETGTPPETSQINSSQTNQTEQSDQTNTLERTGKYIDYADESTLLNATGNKVLFFHAPWCSQCRSVEAGIIADGVPEGFTIIKVDYDSNQELRKKHGVALQTTFVRIDDENNTISKFVAYEEPNFNAVIRDYLL